MDTGFLGDRYQLGDPIGRGLTSQVFRARDIQKNRIVAIKILKEQYSADPKFVAHFQRTAKAQSAFQHPNVMQVYGFGQANGKHFIVMELVEGTDLRRYLRARGVLDVDRAVIIAHSVALGLGAIHRHGMVHGDVQPQHILLSRDGSIKLIITRSGMEGDMMRYRVPEQAQGGIAMAAADIYGLGLTLYEMLTGRSAFDGNTPVAMAMAHLLDAPIPPAQFNPTIPPALEAIILRCLEKKPEMRFQDGDELAHALEMMGDSIS